MSVSGAQAKAEPSREHAGVVRVVTATSLFDGHDAAINIVRRILQSQGAEVIHLGHDRSVDEIVSAAIQEDADAIAVSSYQGGHDEFFRYMIDLLRERGAGHVRVYAGGGGTILPDEVRALQAYGVARIFTPEDGRALGLQRMVGTIVEQCAGQARDLSEADVAKLSPEEPRLVARAISVLERAGENGGAEVTALRAALDRRVDDARRPQSTRPPHASRGHAPVLGLTGTGGAGKSSVADELVRRFRRDAPEAAIALLLVDPSRRRTGGALLGDRIRMNAVHAPRVYVRSLATRRANRALSGAVADAVRVLQASGFDLILIETAGIGQGDSEIVDLVDISTYVMTPEFGAPSQLEKIDMIDLADAVILNKADRPRAEDALRDVRKQWRRNRTAFQLPDEQVPVFATVASQWDDPGIERAYEHLRRKVSDAGGKAFTFSRAGTTAAHQPEPVVPAERVRYLAEIAATVRGYRTQTAELAERAADAEGLARAARTLGGPAAAIAEPLAPAAGAAPEVRLLLERYAETLSTLGEHLQAALRAWPATRARYEADTQSYGVRGREISVDNTVETLAHTRLPRVALPSTNSWADLTRYLRSENVPGEFPFTAGVFPFKREGEEPGRMFAGEGGPERTNRRFHLLAKGQKAVRLSTAFDSVTLYGRDPDPRPDVYGKVGNSGVSVCTVDDAKKLYSGFDLCDPKTSVSMTINGPAPTVLAFFLNAAIDQQVEKHLRERGELESVRARFAARGLPSYGGALPDGHDGLGLGLLGIAGDEAVPPDIYARIAAQTLRSVRGTVQADILKEDQAQNTCIFSTSFALKMMGDVQAFFVQNGVRNFYSVSVSGYHIAEAGANPITQLAFTLANGFTYVEHYLARGMKVDDFAPNFSFFFSNGLDAEYNVIGRVARRIWAIALRERYGANERSQKLKYHVQTSGRSLHAQEMAFNDIRTTLQALLALEDHCNSLHTNAYDEAVTTPTEESVRRALAIQLIIQRELGLSKNENPIQGAYVIEKLTDLVEEAVLEELERLSARGGVLGAMETLYQRAKIQEESLYYESLKHDGKLPIIGVNTFENPDAALASARPAQVARSSEAEKRAQLGSLRAFWAREAERAPAALTELQHDARSGENVFAALMQTVKHCSLGQISDALFQVGGAYRRAM
jgi:methylmalonyl-CoA mutase